MVDVLDCEGFIHGAFDFVNHLIIRTRDNCEREVGGKRKDNQAKVLSRKRGFEKGDKKQEPGGKRHKSLIKKTQKPAKN